MSGWSAVQREWLRALGHPVLVLAGSEPDTADAEADAPPPHEAERVPDMRGGPVETARLQAGPADAVGPGDGGRRGPAGAPRSGQVDAGAGRAAPGAPEPDVANPQARRTDTAAKAAALAAARRGANERAAAEALREALVRATGLGPGPGARRLRELGADPLALRSDPAAKRALWARLRQVRKDARR